MTAPRIVHLHLHMDLSDGADASGSSQVLDAVQQIQATLGAMQQEGITMSKELDDLTAAVTRSATVQSSAVELLKGLSQQITDAGTDPAALEALATSVNDQADTLAKAVAANTPGHPTDPNNPGAPLSQQIPDPNNPPLDPTTDAPVIVTDPNAGTGVPSDTPQVPLPNTDTTTPPADTTTPPAATDPTATDPAVPTDASGNPVNQTPGVNTEGTPA